MRGYVEPITALFTILNTLGTHGGNLLYRSIKRTRVIAYFRLKSATIGTGGDDFDEGVVK